MFGAFGPARDGAGHDGAHAVHFLQRLLARVEDGVQLAEARRQQPRRLRARVADAEGEEQVGQRTSAAGLHARDEVGRVAGAEAAVVEAQVRQRLHGRLDALRRPRLEAGAVLRANEGVGHGGADAVHRAQFLPVRIEQGADLPEVTLQRVRVALAQALGQAQLGQLVGPQVVDVGHVAHEPLAEEDRREALAEALDVHGPARGEVLDEAHALLRAGAVGAEGIGGVLLALDGGGAGGAGRGHGENALGAVAQAEHGRHHLRDHVARALHDHGVADADVLAVDVLLVVERGHAHARAAHHHRGQHGEGVERARAAHVHGDVEQLRGALLGRELVGRGPARLAPHHAHLRPRPGVVDLHHHAVDVVVEPRPPLAPPAHALVRLGEGGVAAGVAVHAEAERAQPLQPLEVARRRGAVAPAQLVDVDGERALRRDRRVELAHGPRRRVARVGEERLAPLPALRVHALEAALRHVGLAAHLEGGRTVPRQRQRDAADGAQVGGHVLAAPPVAARGPVRQPPVLVDEGDGEAVDLRLRGEREIVAVRALRGAAQPVRQLRLRGGVGEAEQGLAVLHRGEGVERGRARALRGRIGRDQLGPGGLDGAQLGEQLVVLAVADFGRVEHVVAVVVVVDARPQLLAAEPRLVLGRFGHAPRF